MINLVVSIPAHERAEVIIEQIANIKHFCPTCAIVLHISSGFNWRNSNLTEKEFLSAVRSFDKVFINPVRLKTARAEIIHTHIANFEYVSKIVDFEYFAMNASNELFVRHMPPISDCDLCAHIIHSYVSCYWYKKVTNDEYIYKILDYLGCTKEDICKSQIEGSFYRKELFQQIINVINQIYPREEFYFSTIARILNKTANFKVHQPNYTFVAWGNRNFLPTHEQIIEVAQGKMNGRFSVKRVSRNLDDTERIFIGTQIGNYRQEAINLMINAKGNRPSLSYSTDKDDSLIDINAFANRFSPSYTTDMDVTKLKLDTPPPLNKSFYKGFGFRFGKRS